MHWLIGLSGIVLAVAPFVMGYSAIEYALWASVGFGGVAVVVALWRFIAEDTGRWEYWVAGIAGAGALLAPWVLGFSTETTPTATHVVLGLVLIVISLYALSREAPSARMT